MKDIEGSVLAMLSLSCSLESLESKALGGGWMKLSMNAREHREAEDKK